MDAERGYSEERWYTDDRGYAEPEWRDSRRGGSGYDDRLPAQRGFPEPGPAGFNGPGPAGYNGPGPAEPAYGSPREPAYDSGFDARTSAPTSGEPRPAGGLYGPRPDRSHSAPEQPQATRSERSGRGDRGDRSGAEGVYRSRKPLHAAGLAIFLGLFELVMLAQFFRGIVNFDLHRVLSGGLTLMALPSFGLGFYALLTGAAYAGPRAFLKTPLAYLPVGLILMVAAGAAA